jgi:hypothetical protein
MDLLAAIVTSGAVSAIVAGLFKWWSDTDQSRRIFLSGVLTEAYKREAKVYEDLWKAMFALQESAANFLTTYSMSTHPSGLDISEEQLKADGNDLVKSATELVRVMDQNRPFFHRDVYIAIKSFGEYTKSEQWMRLQYPALYDMKGTLAGEPQKAFDYERSIDEMMRRIDEVSTQIRARMTTPEEAFISSWMLSGKQRLKSVNGGADRVK